MCQIFNFIRSQFRADTVDLGGNVINFKKNITATLEVIKTAEMHF